MAGKVTFPRPNAQFRQQVQAADSTPSQVTGPTLPLVAPGSKLHRVLLGQPAAGTGQWQLLVLEPHIHVQTPLAGSVQELAEATCITLKLALPSDLGNQLSFTEPYKAQVQRSAPATLTSTSVLSRFTKSFSLRRSPEGPGVVTKEAVLSQTRQHLDSSLSHILR